jgi:hypothetical protein
VFVKAGVYFGLTVEEMQKFKDLLTDALKENDDAGSE